MILQAFKKNPRRISGTDNLKLLLWQVYYELKRSTCGVGLVDKMH